MRFLWFALLALLLTSTTSPVQACSGGDEFPWDSFLESIGNDTDTIVVGSFVERDDAQINGILKVDTYLQGQGAEYITIIANDPRMSYNDDKINRYYGCGMAYVRTEPVVEEGYYVYFLNKLDIGAYKTQSFFPIYYFETADSTVQVGYRAEKAIELNLLEMQTELLSALGTPPQLPNPDLPYPRTAPVLVTTTTRNHYMIPMDFNIPLPVPDEELVDLQRTQHTCYAPCVAWSPNNLDKVYLVKTQDEIIQRDYRGSNYNFMEHDIVGERISFSANSESYALWVDSNIKVYMLWYPYRGSPENLNLEGTRPRYINQTLAFDSVNFPAIWSEDSTQLTFSTSEGLWQWDLLTIGYPPQLVIPTNGNIPVARYFSPQGRYLAVSEGDKHYTLDLVSKRQLPDGVISTDDRRILVYDTLIGQPTEYYILQLLSQELQQLGRQKLWHGEWTDSNTFIAAVAGNSYIEWVAQPPYPDGTIESFPERIDRPFMNIYSFFVPASPYGQWLSVAKPHMLDFDYDANLGLLQLGVDRYWLRIGDKALIYLRGLVDAPIAEITWLPSVFYYD